MNRTVLSLLLLAILGVAAVSVNAVVLSACSQSNSAPCTPTPNDAGDAAVCPPVTGGGGGGGGVVSGGFGRARSFPRRLSADA